MKRRTSRIRILLMALAGIMIIVACGGQPPELPSYSVVVEIDGVGSGSVVSDPEGIALSSGDDPVSGEFEEGTEVTLSATAAEGSVFSGWGGACSGTEPCVLTVEGDVEVTATFDLQLVTLTVTTSGNGTGSVQSDPSGIDLVSGEPPASAEYEYGTVVTLTASAEPGSMFGGWTNGDDCVGTDPCTLVLVSDVSVNADFFDPDTDPATTTFSILASSDDAQEYQEFVNEAYPAGSVHSDSSDLDLTYDTAGDGSGGTRGDVVIGLRYAGVSLPRNAVILDARISFTRSGTAADNAGTVTLSFKGQAHDDATTFVYGGAGNPVNFDITGRPTTATEIIWNVTSSWGGLPVPSVNLAAIVQEIVDRDGWNVGNALVFIISSDDSDADNRREARSYDYASANPGVDAPVLSVTYYVPSAP